MQAKVSGKRRKKMAKECLMDAILDPINLQNAQDAVRRNKGCAGIDGRSIADDCMDAGGRVMQEQLPRPSSIGNSICLKSKPS